MRMLSSAVMIVLVFAKPMLCTGAEIYGELRISIGTGNSRNVLPARAGVKVGFCWAPVNCWHGNPAIECAALTDQNGKYRLYVPDNQGEYAESLEVVAFRKPTKYDLELRLTNRPSGGYEAILIILQQQLLK